MPLIDYSSTPADDNRTARYKAVSRLAVISLVLGGLSILLVLGWLLILLPMAALVAGFSAVRRIARSRDELTGEPLAWTGIGLGTAFLLFGSGWLWFVQGNEAPMGYQKVDYVQLQPDASVAGEKVPPKVLELEGKRVFIKGYMMPTRQQVRLKAFLICPTNGVCTFHFPNPKPTEVIRVKLCGDLTTDYTTRLVGLGGLFHVNPDDPRGTPYSIEADCLR